MTDSPKPPSDWNELDGPPPTAEEREDAERLAGLLARPADEAAKIARERDDEVESLLVAALRVRATVHPDHGRDDGRVKKVVTEVIDASHGRRGWRKAIRSPWAWAAAAVLVAAVGVGSRVGDEARSPAAISRSVDDVFDRPVEPGAASAPSSSVFDARLGAYRATLLGGEGR